MAFSVHGIVQNPADDKDIVINTVYQIVPGCEDWFTRHMVATEAEMPRIHAVAEFGSTPGTQAERVASHITNGSGNQSGVPALGRLAEMRSRPSKDRVDIRYRYR